MILVGIDEAGYGPTLGPLVVSAAVFRVADGLDGEPDLWGLLDDTVTRKPDRSRIPVNDSKKIYRPGKGVGALEEGIFPFLEIACAAAAVEPPADLRALVRYLCRSTRADAYLESYPWYSSKNLDLPADTYPNFCRVLGERLARDLTRHELEFLGITSAPIHVLEFNRLLDISRNKALVPFDAIGSLLARISRSFPGENISAIVDRQGGRINYSRLLFDALKPKGITIGTECEEFSSYSLRRGGRADRDKRCRFDVTFTRQGDSKSFLVALASMVSKYVREVHMRLFNEFWAGQQDALKPTAGYPTDARRFLKDIEETRRRLGVTDRALIRQR